MEGDFFKKNAFFLVISKSQVCLKQKLASISTNSAKVILVLTDFLKFQKTKQNKTRILKTPFFIFKIYNEAFVELSVVPVFRKNIKNWNYYEWRPH